MNKHIPCINIYLCLFHQHKQYLFQVYLLFPQDIFLFCPGFALYNVLSFFRVMPKRLNAFIIAVVLQLNTSAVSFIYESGCSFIYSFNFSGFIFLNGRFNGLFSKSPFSFNCFSHLCIVETAILTVFPVFF